MGASWNILTKKKTILTEIQNPIEIDTFYGTRIEGVKNILRLPSSKVNFLTYLNAIKMEHKFLHLIDPTKFDSLDLKYLEESSNYLVSEYQPELDIYLTNSESILYYLSQAKSKEIIIVLLNAFNDFFQSEFYCSPSGEKFRRKSLTHVSYGSTASRASVLSGQNHLLDHGFNDNISECSSFSSLVFSLQQVHSSICICSADKSKGLGFPIIFINPAFTILTGYSLDEVEGRNPKFLQGGKAEIESVEEMSDALCEGKLCQVSLTNYRKDGIPFKNLVTLIPIYDESGNYLYVVGIHFDVTKPGMRLLKKKLADEIVKLIPKVLLNDDYATKDDSLYNSK